jgi:hypothetical protein
LTTLDPADLRIRVARSDDLKTLAAFRCSRGEPWEDEVEQQIRGPLPRRYLWPQLPALDPRLLLTFHRRDERLVAVGAHHIEPRVVQVTISYLEVIAVDLAARGTLVETEGQPITLGHFMFEALITDMLQRERHPVTFARADRRNEKSLKLCERIGLNDVRELPGRPDLVELWGDV